MEKKIKYDNSFLQEFLYPTKPFDGGIPIPPPKQKIKVESPRKK